MLSAFRNSFKIPELRTRILFAFALIIAERLVANIPTPGIMADALEQLVRSATAQPEPGAGSLFGMADLFSGGALRKCSVGALTIWPYISASIVLQLLTAVVPALERLAREGDVGRQKITQYSRYLTLGICILQSFAVAKTIENPRMLFQGAAAGISLVSPEMSVWGFRLLTMLSMTTGTMVIMWMGEQITQRGIGNGISLIITVNIVSRLPQAVLGLWDMFRGTGGGFNIFHLVSLFGTLFIVTAATVAVTQSQRKVPITTTKKVVGRKVYGGQNTFMPLRMNYANVMPLIFASSLLMFPPLLLGRIDVQWCKDLAQMLYRESWLYMLMYGTLIMFFSYFWVATQFNPVQIADDLKKHGGYVPGIRPGRPTAEFLDKTMSRLTLAGAIFLTAIAIIPSLLHRLFKIPYEVSQFFGGTSLLIVVGVMLDTMRQVESHLLMRHYDGFLRKGRLRGSGRR
jgi:preprotein translocase subunit SecY